MTLPQRMRLRSFLNSDDLIANAVKYFFPKKQSAVRSRSRATSATVEDQRPSSHESGYTNTSQSRLTAC